MEDVARGRGTRSQCLLPSFPICWLHRIIIFTFRGTEVNNTPLSQESKLIKGEVEEAIDPSLNSQSTRMDTQETKVETSSLPVVKDSTNNTQASAKKSSASNLSKVSLQQEADSSLAISVNEDSKELYDITFTMSIAIAVPTGKKNDEIICSIYIDCLLFKVAFNNVTSQGESI